MLKAISSGNVCFCVKLKYLSQQCNFVLVLACYQTFSTHFLSSSTESSLKNAKQPRHFQDAGLLTEIT